MEARSQFTRGPTCSKLPPSSLAPSKVPEAVCHSYRHWPPALFNRPPGHFQMSLPTCPIGPSKSTWPQLKPVSVPGTWYLPSKCFQIKLKSNATMNTGAGF